MKMFNLINIGERAGSGVLNIFNGWEEPIIEERFAPDRTVLTLSFVKKVNQNTSTAGPWHNIKRQGWGVVLLKCF